jgi:hypothetical protein
MVKSYRNFLSLLSELSLRQMKALISHFTKGQITALREVFVNILAGNVNLTPDQKKELAPYKTFIRKFAQTSIKRCRLNRHCRAILLALKAAKSTFDQI